MKVAILGSSGQLGTDLVRAFTEAERYEVVSLTHAQIEVTSPESVQRTLAGVCPNIVVNCAAFHRVDECEDRPEEAFQVNSLGALNVARACAQLDALCAYVSTDSVFGGETGKPYTEEDTACPINVYGASKLAGEILVRQACPRWLIVRVASLFGKAGARGKGGNFVETILGKARSEESLRVVSDIRISPTYTCDAARALERLLRQGATGLFHLTNDGDCTWYEFAKKAVELVGLETKLEPISSADYPYKARRPKNSSLESIRLDPMIRKDLRPWQQALKAYLEEKASLCVSSA